MKYLKVLVPLLVVLAILVVALPVSAQGPAVKTTDGRTVSIFVRTAGTNEDPFGGLPLLTSSGLGAASKFGVGGPGVWLIPGGKPSTNSGDGTSPRKAIYIGGAWAHGSRAELPSCATVKVPAGTSRWFKTDTWKDKRLQIWLDDELNTATAPSGSAVFGAADAYMWGLAPNSAWAANYWDTPGVTSYNVLAGPLLEGFVMSIYDPNNMRPNYAYDPPNAALYTTSYTAGGGVRRSGQGVVPPGAGASVSVIIGEFYIHGYAQYNPVQPNHLLWWEGVMDGWVHARVFNQMIWDGVVTVCSYRAAK